jgi:glyoxylase-like metal-dependent hydrolase (beta-lactamase superfamily II)
MRANRKGGGVGRFIVGEAAIDSVLELELTGRPIAWLGTSPELIDAHRWWLAPHFLQAGDTWSLNFRSWIVRIDGKIIVVDPCNGNGRPNPVPMFDDLDIPFIERFEATGVRVEDVDFVFCTHMHHDHCGWNTMLRDGRWVPTFPNARYVFVKREYARWHPDNAKHFQHLDYNDGVYERSIAPIVEAGLADFVAETHRLSPSLWVKPGPGHTDGHCMLHLQTGGAEAMFSGDAFHHPLQLIEHSIRFGDHDNWEAVIETRRRLVRDSLERDMLIIPAHLPFPHAGRMRNDDEGLRFEGLC